MHPLDTILEISVGFKIIIKNLAKTRGETNTVF